MKKILILGSNSFAGSCLINYLLNKNFKITGISRSKEKNKNELLYKKNKKLRNFKFIKFDLNKNYYSIVALIKREKFDYIVDFLGQGMVAESWENPEHWFQTNVQSKVKLINYLKNQKFLKRYIRISTPEVYGSSKNLLKEESIFNPSTPYAITHMTIDFYLSIMFKRLNFPVIIMRFANFYGEYQPLYRIIPKTIIAILSKKKLPLHGKGLSLRSFIYIEDFCSAILAGLKRGKIGETYNISSKEIFSIREVIQLICLKMKYNFKKVVKYQKDRPSKDFKYFMNSKKANKKLNWKSKISFDEGITQTINWYKNNFNNLKKNKDYYVHKI